MNEENIKLTNDERTFILNAVNQTNILGKDAEIFTELKRKIIGNIKLTSSELILIQRIVLPVVRLITQTADKLSQILKETTESEKILVSKENKNGE